MAKYRRIGIEIEAVQYTGSGESRQACLELAGITLDCGSWALAGARLKIYCSVGIFSIGINEWLIKYAGKLHTNSDYEFKEKYEKIEG